jgi:cytochrome c5
MLKIFLGFIAVSILSTASYLYATDYFYGNQAIVQQKVVQFDPNYFLGVQGYYTVGEQITKEKQDLNQDKIDKLIDLITKLIEAKAGTPATPAPTPEPPIPEPPKVDELQAKVNTLFKTKCFSCHSNDKNGLDMFNDAGEVEVSLADAVSIHYRVEGIALDGNAMMPKGGKPLTNDEMTLVKKWLIKKAKGE